MAEELSSLRQQVEVLQQQNTQLMSALAALSPQYAAIQKNDSFGSSSLAASQNSTTGVIVLGASGDLAKKKTYPALFHLFRKKLIPPDTVILGYARTKMDRAKFQAHLSGVIKGFESEWAAFMDRCWYIDGDYGSASDMERASVYLEKLHSQHGNSSANSMNRIFYMALPPTVFISAAQALKAKGMSSSGWNRIIVEKPFGRDLESSNKMNAELSALFAEPQLYRIDHYLGKEIVQNLMALRFANSTFEPIWNNRYISNIRITFRENFGCEGRAGYFDQSGIIRDVMQNHLLQTLSLIAMEAPVSLNSEDVRDEKVKVLRAISPVSIDDVVVGQYGSDPKGTILPYLQETGVPADSVTPTFATAVLHINNPRWEGVPFILKAGKGLNERKVDIRIQFKSTGSYLFPNTAANELVFIVQPNEAIYLKMMTKIPGLTDEVAQTELDLTYRERFASQEPTDAYERLILDVFRGTNQLFVRADELEAAWKIFTPVLHQLESEKKKPLQYPFFSRGPPEAEALAERYGFKRYDGYTWPSSKS